MTNGSKVLIYLTLLYFILYCTLVSDAKGNIATSNKSELRNIDGRPPWYRSISSVNPKRPGLFGLPNTRGGVESTHFEKRSLTTPHFHSRPANSISYESWHILLKFDTLLRLLRLKLRPREAAEVAKVQAKKIRSKILKSAIFELQKHYIPQKKAENNCHSDLK